MLYSHDQLYKHICMQHHNDDTIKTSGHSSLEKYTSHFIERVVCERELETEQNCNILTPTLMAITMFLSRSPGLLNRGPGGPASLGHVPHSSIFSPTDWTSCALSFIIVRQPPSSCGHHKSHSFNPSMVKVIFWYPSTVFTCYLHRSISYFEARLGRRSIYNINSSMVLHY